MQRAAAFVLLAVVAATSSACFGAPTTVGQGGGTPVPATDWTIRYSIGMPVARIADLPGCPAGSTCAPVRVGEGSDHWMLGVTRLVSCPTGRGDLTQPADCAAIVRLRKDLAQPRMAACRCPYRPGIRGVATASEHGRRIRVPLDVCTYCPAGRQVAAALATLTRTR
jgi:hypothetical protein